MLRSTEGDQNPKCNTGVRKMNTLAIDIGGTKFTVALFENERMTRRESRPTNREGGPEWMLAQIRSIALGWQRESGFERCGIGFGGPVDVPRQRVALSTHVGGWQDFPLVPRVKELFGVPVVIDNDANAAALGEARYGGHGALPLFYMTLSTGIGGGLVLKDGTVYRGADSWAGEIGHLTVRPDGFPNASCGARGCLERMCSGLWLKRDCGKPAQELFRDPAFVERYVIDLTLGLKAAIMLLNPERIVIGGGIAKAGEGFVCASTRGTRAASRTYSLVGARGST